MAFAVGTAVVSMSFTSMGCNKFLVASVDAVRYKRSKSGRISFPYFASVLAFGYSLKTVFIGMEIYLFLDDQHNKVEQLHVS
jgi:hypothetical protein